MHIVYRKCTETRKFKSQSHSYRTKLVATTSKYKETFQRIIPPFTCISSLLGVFSYTFRLSNYNFLPLQNTLVVYHLHGQTGQFTVWIGLGKW